MIRIETFIVTLLFIFFDVHNVQVRATYFSMAELEMTIPFFFSMDNRILTHLYTLHNNNDNYVDKNVNNKDSNADSSNVNNKTLKYVLQGNENHFEILDGNLAFTEKFIRNYREVNDLSNISVGISVEDSSGHRDKTTFSVRVMRGEPTVPSGKSKKMDKHGDHADCKFLVMDLCYWQSADYRIYENSKSSTIGTLSSPYLQSLCPGYRINYTMESKDDRIVEIIEDTFGWRINTTRPLERDVQRRVIKEHKMQNKNFAGEYVNFTIVCYVEDPTLTRREIPKQFALKVLDENDNPPIRQGNSGDVFIVYEHPLIKQHTKIILKSHDLSHNNTHQLIFTDRDSVEVNNHEVTLLNDTYDIFDVQCRALNEDRDGERQTVQFCELSYKRDVNLDDINSSNYTVMLQINDTTMLPSNESSYTRVAIHLTHPNDERLPKDLRPLILYPDRYNLIFRLAGPLARVTNPPLPVASYIGNFTLIARDPTHLNTFDITNKDGIIYVHNITSLRESSASIRIDVQWEKYGKYECDQLIIEIKDHPSRKCAKIRDHISSWTHCSNFANSDDCEAACAIGSGGSASIRNSKNSYHPKLCQWRGHKSAMNISTEYYNTCTPDIRTCPDKICDSLEMENWKLCPQDCTKQVVFPTVLNKKTLRGISHARGVCTCSGSGNCVCGLASTKSVKGQKKKTTDKVTSNETTDSNLDNATTTADVVPNLSRHTGMDVASCGTICLLGILAVGIFLLATITSIVACWRLDKVNRMRGKISGNHNDLSAPLSTYVDRGLPPENTITLNFDMTTSLAKSDKDTPDPKWEFPRSQLIIEQTLGEGEFGRVLRARAKDISGHSGYTIVAVKTLKDDAHDAELADLLSEYQLLKEVSHPNVIKLLGASTLPGGPVYLIIEYAQYGSLRSYLRRSRHLKSETHLPRFAPCFVDETLTTNDNYDQPKTCNVTPKDILSFAWQIANGMSYLTEIKLVHRDLAARNVLLSEEKVCKISDFGLTRDIYEDDAYFKRSKGRVPVKWMAPESLTHHVYTIKSDVWSFGILIWELVTLGATPYPGIQVHNLYHLLKSGYRMERPENCSLQLYKIMKSCWHNEPEKRPSFHGLSNTFEKMLEDQVEYLNLTANAIHNRSYFCTLSEGDQKDEMRNDDEEFETNLEKNSPRGKFLNNEKLVEEKINNLLLENNNDLKPLELRPAGGQQGYETPVKTQIKAKYANTENVTSDPSTQYYTNMEATNKNNASKNLME